jgi:hypothetical protein
MIGQEGLRQDSAQAEGIDLIHVTAACKTLVLTFFSLMGADRC